MTSVRASPPASIASRSAPDNSSKFDLGGFVSILYEGTQTNWNGLVGRLELRAAALVRIDSQRVFARNDGSVTVEASVRNDLLDPIEGTISATVAEKATGKVCRHGQRGVRLRPRHHEQRSPYLHDAGRGEGLLKTLVAAAALERVHSRPVRGANGTDGQPPSRNRLHGDDDLRFPRVGDSRHAVRAQRPADLPSRHAGMRNLSADRLSAHRRAGLATDLSRAEILRPEFHAIPFLVSTGGRLRRGRPRGRLSPGGRSGGKHSHRPAMPPSAGSWKRSSSASSTPTATTRRFA